MTSPRILSRRSLLTVAWWTSMLTAALALAGLIIIVPGSGKALAADSYNQMTGSGATASAVTVNWTSGLLDGQNQPLTTSARTDGGTELAPNSARAAGTGQLSFMYPDFKDIQVTVSQTENISHQGVSVTWTGANPTNGGSVPRADFMQLMECWGDASTGPSPDDCQFGSQGMLGSGANAAIGERGGYLCKPGEVISTTSPPKGYGNNAAYGCDVNEPTGETPSHCNSEVIPGDNCAAPDGFYEIPFVGVDAQTTPLYGQQNLLTDFSSLNSNEVQDGVTNTDRTGQVQFETLTSIEAPHLGCGALEAAGQPDAGKARACWLVIVPRGNYEPNGYAPSGFTVPGGYLNTSPLSASNWAQRIQVHLGYAPLGTACPPTVLPEPAVGTQLVSRAVSSWELALNLAANCKTVYAFTAESENLATTAIEGIGPSHAGMAFTTIPIGSEATRYAGGAPPSMPNVLYAPVAVTAMDLGFNINEGAGYVNTPVKLTPQVLARTLTQAYRNDLPDYLSFDLSHPGPVWAQGNPGNMTEDPAFQALNPPSEITTISTGLSLAPLLPEDHSALNQQLWQWVQTDQPTSTWLDTASTPADTVQADPDYASLGLGASPAQDSFPRAYSGVLDLGQCTADQGCTTPKEEKLVSIDMLPFALDIGTAAAQVLAGNDTALTNTWDPLAHAADTSLGWWDKVGVLPPGTTFMSALSDLPDVASYGLVAAALCNPSGASCVVPSIDSVTTTLNAATADSSGLLEVNPATVPAGGYPLVQVVYAAVPTSQSAQALTDYATLIKYAVNQGQVAGSNPGDLPPGYLPLTPTLQAQANAVVQQLQQLANPTPTTSPTGTATPTQSATQQTTTSGGSTTTGGTTTGGTTTGGTTTGGTTTGGTTTGGTTTGGTTTGGTTTGGTTTGGSGTVGPTSTASAHSTGSGSPSPGTSTVAAGPSIIPPRAELAAGTTAPTAVGAIRRSLIIVLIIGGAGAVGGGLLRLRGIPRPGRTRRPRAGP